MQGLEELSKKGTLLSTPISERSGIEIRPKSLVMWEFLVMWALEAMALMWPCGSVEGTLFLPLLYPVPPSSRKGWLDS
jgi:hypothetical protein